MFWLRNKKIVFNYIYTHRSGGLSSISCSSFSRCDSVDSVSDQRIQDEGITANQIVFSFWLPHPRDNQQLDFSRWQQTLMGVLILEVGYDPKFELGKKKPRHMTMILCCHTIMGESF